MNLKLNNEFNMCRAEWSRYEVIKNYNRRSRWYDHLAESNEKKYLDMGLKNLRINQDEEVPEIGFGTGHGIKTLAIKVSEQGLVAGNDIFDQMCLLARENVMKNNIAERLILVCGDAAYLHFKSDIFNSIFISFTLELFDTPEIPVVLQECKRVLH
jgi:ubiquinone/menaquinone biosynthesis C-methylase UbiE